MKLYTRSGDDGHTNLLGPKRVPKDDARVTAYGEVDELNAGIGLATTVCPNEDMLNDLHIIQRDLFVLGAQLATPDDHTPKASLDPARITRLEQWIDAADARLPTLKEFILPGGSELGARLHLARTVCRRAERLMVHLGHGEPVTPQAIGWINRLSDLLFAMSRAANHVAGVADVPWQAKGGRGENRE